MIVLLLIQKIIKFQHTAARRRLRNQCGLDIIGMWVSTHSRPKAAAEKVFASNAKQGVSTHSRPKAAAFGDWLGGELTEVSTHSRPKAAARFDD